MSRLHGRGFPSPRSITGIACRRRARHDVLGSIPREHRQRRFYDGYGTMVDTTSGDSRTHQSKRRNKVFLRFAGSTEKRGVANWKGQAPIPTLSENRSESGGMATWKRSRTSYNDQAGLVGPNGSQRCRPRRVSLRRINLELLLQSAGPGSFRLSAVPADWLLIPTLRRKQRGWQAHCHINRT